jgi:PEGA domain
MTRAFALLLSLLTALPSLAAEDRLRTVILGVSARRGMDDKQLAAALTDVVQGVYGTDASRTVIGRDDIMRVMELEADKQQLGCDSDKCLAEVGAALDAARLVTGSIDKLGDGYMVTLSEIDAKSLVAVGRVQARTSTDENQLVDTVTQLANDLMKKSSLQTATGLVVANAGSLEVSSDPRGAKVLLSGSEMGASPTKIDNLATGTQKLRLVRDDYEPVEVDVPIYPGGTTKVNAELRIIRPLAEKNLEMRQAAWREKNQWHTVGAWTKVGAGGVVGVLGGLWGGASLLGGNTGAGILGLGIGGVGAGFLAWGVLDLLNPPPQPVPEWEMERKVTVTPPNGHGEQQVHVIQAAAQSPLSVPAKSE